MTTATQIQDSEFEELLLYEGPVVVDFTASWCGPCRKISPLIDQLAEEYQGRAKVVKLDIEQNKETPKKYGVRSIPAVLIFKSGELVEHLVGAKPYEEFSGAVAKYLET
ncbi:MAG: thioredoxin [Symploca sp. SIO2G7]|nr:thioredoxin [Symploca sp. SIO2G7]